MTQAELVTHIKKEASEDKVVEDCLCVFAMRRRARTIVTLSALVKKMEKEGFKYKRTQYASFLKKLAHLGIGKLEIDHKGNVVALKDIKVHLKSLGSAAMGDQKSIQSFKSRNRFIKLVDGPAPRASEPKKAAFKADTRTGLPVTLTVYYNDKPINVPVPAELTDEEIAGLITRFRYK